MPFLCSYIIFNASSLYLRSSTDVSHLIEVELLCEALQNIDVELQADFITGLEKTLADAISRERL